MKKLISILTFLFILTGLQAQKGLSLFGHVSQKAVDRGIFDNGQFVFSLDAVVAGPTWTFENGFDKPIPIQGAAIAIGYKHLKPDLKSDWGVSIALSNKFKMGEEQTQQVGIALLPNYYNLMVGPVWFIGNKYPGIMVGGSITL